MSTPQIDHQIVSNAEETLELLGSVLKSSTENSLIGTDLDGKIVLWNEGARRIYGYESEEVVGRADAAILHTPEDIQAGRPRAMRDGALRDGKWEGTIKRVRKDGQQFTARVVITPRHDATGRPIGFLLISKDISDEIRLADQLEATKLFTRSLMESNIDALMTTDLLGIITDVNQQMVALTGSTRDELIGSPLKDYFTDPQRVEEGIRLVLGGRKVTNDELIARSRDGRLTAVTYNASIFRDAVGSLRGVFATARVTTEQKQLEQNLHEPGASNRGLIFRPAVRHLLLRYGIAFLFTGAALLCRVPFWSFLGASIPFTFFWPAIMFTAWYGGFGPGVLATLLSTLAGAYFIFEPQFSFVVANPVDRVGIVLFALLGVLISWLVSRIRRRIDERTTKLIELNQRVHDRTTQLEASNRELEAFSYSVSHDLRAPLRAIDGFSRILLEEYAPQLPGEARHYLQMTRQNSQQMGQLIDGMLTYSRLGRQALQKRPVAPADLVCQAWENLRAARADRHVEIQIGQLPLCQGDPILLEQVFLNLLDNALKFTRGREVARIEVGCEGDDRQPDGCIYFVKDNGVGFDMQYAHKLFGVFQRLHRAEDYEGTGIGLAIVQRIVHRHGGRVWAEAQPDKGAAFYFTLGGESVHD